MMKMKGKNLLQTDALDTRERWNVFGQSNSLRRGEGKWGAGSKGTQPTQRHRHIEKQTIKTQNEKLRLIESRKNGFKKSVIRKQKTF